MKLSKQFKQGRNVMKMDSLHQNKTQEAMSIHFIKHKKTAKVRVK